MYAFANGVWRGEVDSVKKAAEIKYFRRVLGVRRIERRRIEDISN